MMREKQQRQRFEQLLDSATAVFIDRGYRRAKMADIAGEMGVSPGTIYLYVEGKEVLFDLVIRRHLLGEQPEVPGDLPIGGQTLEDSLGVIREAIGEVVELLEETLDSDTPENARDEFEELLLEWYDIIAEYHLAIRLIEASAVDWPELSDLFYNVFRQRALDSLRTYLELRSSEGVLRKVPSSDVGARLINETVAWFAMHRHGDPHAGDFTDEEARQTVVEVLLHAFVL
jgi:AcrR family transcriptional regulator